MTKDIKGAARRREKTKTSLRRSKKSHESRRPVSSTATKASTTSAKEPNLSPKCGTTSINASNLNRREKQHEIGNDSLLISGEEAITPAQRKPTPSVKIIPPTVPRAVSKVVPTMTKPVVERRRSLRRLCKTAAPIEAIAAEQNTIADAGLYTGSVIPSGCEQPATQELAEASSLPPAFCTRFFASKRESILSPAPTGNVAPASRGYKRGSIIASSEPQTLHGHKRSSTITTFEPQAHEKETPSAVSSSKPKRSASAGRRRLRERDEKGGLSY